MKNQIVNIRINEAIKTELDFIADEEGKSVSDIVRNAVEFFLEKKPSIAVDDDTNSSSNEDLKLFQSLGFTELIFWILDKYRDPSIRECDELFKQFIKLILEMENNSFFDQDIMLEFRKVYDELNEYLYENSHEGIYFNFCEIENGFDYEKLHNFMHTIRYDDDDNRVIFIK